MWSSWNLSFIWWWGDTLQTEHSWMFVGVCWQTWSAAAAAPLPPLLLHFSCWTWYVHMYVCEVVDIGAGVYNNNHPSWATHSSFTCMCARLLTSVQGCMTITILAGPLIAGCITITNYHTLSFTWHAGSLELEGTLEGTAGSTTSSVDKPALL